VRPCVEGEALLVAHKVNASKIAADCERANAQALAVRGCCVGLSVAKAREEGAGLVPYKTTRQQLLAGI